MKKSNFALGVDMFHTCIKYKKTILAFVLLILILLYKLVFAYGDNHAPVESSFAEYMQKTTPKERYKFKKVKHEAFCSSISAEDEEKRIDTFFSDIDGYKKPLKLERPQQIGSPKHSCDFSSTTSLEAMFLHDFDDPLKIYKSTYYEELGISHWDVAHIKNMSGLFYAANSSIDISAWDTGKVEDMSFMFFGSSFNHDISRWNVSRVRSMKGMFYSSSFNRPLALWNVGKVEDMSLMFSSTEFNQNINEWDVSNVKNMFGMFDSSIFNQPLDRWNVSNVIDMASMFELSTFNQPIGNWDVSNVQDMSSMFYGAEYFNQDLSQWCVIKIKTKPEFFDDNAYAWEDKNKPVWGTCPRGENQRKRNNHIIATEQ